MRNVIILGSGRSGTSMVAGTLAKAGYFMGENFWPTRDANPKGFFESVEINEINEDILEPLIPQRLHLPEIRIKKLRLHIPERVFFRHRPLKWQRWLAEIPVSANIPASPEIERRIEKITQNEPYCFKDPRFSYTLPVWQPYLKNTVFICVFRDPASTAASILKECQNFFLGDEIKGIKISWNQAIKIWTAMYEHILEKHYNNHGEWLFLHYSQAFSEESLKKLEFLTGVSVDRTFPDETIRQSYAARAAPSKTIKIYKKLCHLANYKL